MACNQYIFNYKNDFRQGLYYKKVDPLVQQIFLKDFVIQTFLQFVNPKRKENAVPCKDFFIMYHSALTSMQSGFRL